MVDTHILPGGKKKYFCDLCDKDFDTIQDAVSHEYSCTFDGGSPGYGERGVKDRNYADWTVHQLKWTLKERGLPVSGKKHVLIKRLESSDGLKSYDDWTVKELKEALKERGLLVSGKKRVLIERLKSSEQLSCDSCGKKFKSRNKLFDHLKEFPDHALEGSMAASKPTSEEKNYLEEWALDAEDADLVEQIRKKYRAPSYKTRSKREKQSYPLKLSIAIIVLCFIGICGAYFFEMGPEIERQGGNSDDNFIGCCTSLLLFIILFQSVYNKNKEMDLTSQDTPPIVNFLTGIGVLGFLLAFYLLFLDGNGDSVMDAIICCSSLILLIIPLALFSTESADEKLKNDEQMEIYEKKRWEDAQKHEERSQFDAATGIWAKLGEEGEVERVTKLKIECLCVVLKRKIRDLTGKGANTDELEEQWATIETALEGGATSLSSVGMEGEEVALTVKDSTITPSPDINLKKHTDRSLEEIEEEHHTLASDMTEVDNDSVISKSNVSADEDGKFITLKELTEMKEKGLIDDDGFKQMKKMILGK